jgi:Tol biopolymer transport system component
MKNKFLSKFFCVLFSNFVFFVTAYAGDILIHDGGLEEGVIYMVSPNGSNLKKIGEGILPQWSPNKKYISYVKYDYFNSDSENKLLVVDPEGKEIFNVIRSKDKGRITCHAWNPTGEGIAFLRFGPEIFSVSYLNIKTKNINILHKIRLQKFEDIFCSSIEWSPDGKRLLFSPSLASLERWKGPDLIDLKTGIVKKVSEEGYFHKFVSQERILFVNKFEIWIMNIDGSGKRKIYDTGAAIMAVTKEAKGKIVFQVIKETQPGKLPTRLLLLNLESNKVEEIDNQGYLFFTPAISSDGNKIAAVGVKLKNGELPDNGEECYYVYDLKTKEVTLLKKVETVKNQQQLGGLIMLGFKPIIWD